MTSGSAPTKGRKIARSANTATPPITPTVSSRATQKPTMGMRPTRVSAANSVIAPCAKLNTEDALKMRTNPSATMEYIEPMRRPVIVSSMP